MADRVPLSLALAALAQTGAQAPQAGPGKNARQHWVANQASFIKAARRPAETLSAKDKKPVAAGARLSCRNAGRLGDCLVIADAELDGEKLARNLTFIQHAHWRPASDNITATATEKIRLVIWDLDETFWRGTLTEGGMVYSRAHHDIVIALAKRGIMSSICSKNDFAAVKDILSKEGLWGFVIFPSIDWAPKGPRLAALVEAVQLRPETILFIDDNALNRNEAQHFVPGLRVADETVIDGLLDDDLLQGRNDPDFTRLAQYKLLETRRDAQTAIGDTAAFLRESNIQVSIEHDIEPHLDRAIELINRTNQLNFTKARLPEEPERARRELRQLLNHFKIQAGLVHVQDRYGDYGLVGIYLTKSFASATKLLHFCFSCRILGMGVERFVYDRLGRPELQVSGEVLTDLFAERPGVDWINQDAASSGGREIVARRILVRGGCNMSAAAHYLGLNADEVAGEFNIMKHGRMVRLDHSAFLRNAISGMSPAALQAAARIGYEPADFSAALTADPRSFDACLFNFMNDADYALYRHPQFGFFVPFFEAGHVGGNAARQKFDDIALDGFAKTLNEDGYLYEPPSTARFAETLELILDFIPDTVVLFFLLDPESFAGATLRNAAIFNKVIRDAVAGRPNTHLLEIMDFVANPAERINAVHFSRMVYFRVYQRIAEILRARLPGQVSVPQEAGNAPIATTGPAGLVHALRAPFSKIKLWS